MSRATAVAIRHASAGLLELDRAAAEQVLAEDVVIDRLHDDIGEVVTELLARQQPVASDLRLVLSSVRMAADLERMGALAAHIAKIALRRHPVTAVPPDAREILGQMAEAAAGMSEKVSVLLSSRDPIDAAQMSLDDDVIDALHIRLFELLLAEWRYGVEAAVDLALLGRFYERFADHAVGVARQVVYLVTGDVRA